jgi:hypothetical protein
MGGVNLYGFKSDSPSSQVDFYGLLFGPAGSIALPAAATGGGTAAGAGAAAVAGAASAAIILPVATYLITNYIVNNTSIGDTITDALGRSIYDNFFYDNTSTVTTGDSHGNALAAATAINDPEARSVAISLITNQSRASCSVKKSKVINGPPYVLRTGKLRETTASIGVGLYTKGVIPQGSEAGKAEPAGFGSARSVGFSVDRGHVVAWQLGGKGSQANIATMESEFNRVSFRVKVENKVRKMINNKKQCVCYVSIPLYNPSHRAPNSILAIAVGSKGDSLYEKLPLPKLKDGSGKPIN